MARAWTALIAVVVTASAVLLACALMRSGSPSRGETKTAALRWQERIAVASGEGHRGPWRMNESDYDYVDDPAVAFGQGGVVGVAWVDQARQDVFFQLYAPDGGARLQEPVNVSRSPGTFSWTPRLVFGPGGGEVYFLWQEIVFSGGSHGGEIYFARSTDGGRSFSAAQNLSETTAGAGKGRLTRDRWDNGSLDLARGPGGELYAAWTEYEGALWFRRSVDGGLSFSEPVRIGGDERRPARGPSLAAGAGAVHLAWTVGEDPEADIHYARSLDGGRTFEEARILFETRGHADAPGLATGGDDTVHLVYAAGAAGRHGIHYARSTDGGSSFDGPEEIASAGEERLHALGFPAVEAGGADDVYVVWERFPRRGQRPRGLGVAVSGDGGLTFSAPSVIPGTAEPALGFNGNQQGLLGSKLAAGQHEHIAVGHSTFLPGEVSYVWLYRGRFPGEQ